MVLPLSRIDLAKEAADPQLSRFREGRCEVGLQETQSDEALLLEYASSGNAEAFSLLMKRYWAFAYRVGLRSLGDPVLGEDAAQEAFVALMRGAGRFEHGRPFAP
jgi:hypothetical protein